MNIIQKNEYKRCTFRSVILEAMGRIQLQCCEIDPAKEPMNAARAKAMSDAFYKDMLKLDTATIGEVKKNLAESTTFIKDIVEVAEAISEAKCCEAADAGIEPEKNEEVELSVEDKAIIDKLFDEKAPALQIQQVRDATVKSLLEEDKKAQQIKDALNMANSRVTAGEKPETVQETVNRLSSVGPTSLMNAIMNATAGLAVKDVSENSTTPVSIDKIMSENAGKIRERAVMLYSLYEASSVFGLKTWRDIDVKREAEYIYYGK